ncbi:MAG TPA: hypothetical protein VH120_06675 [Gemmataceae bacterium]|nr:hypothetical protein [Gemmataceae bacterium]
MATVGGGEAFSFHVTELITERNELTIDLTAENGEDGLSGDIALEIRCAAYLTDLRAEASDGRLMVTGSVEGDWVGRLEVYVLADAQTVGYQVRGVGEPFELLTDPVLDTPAEVRVELVNGGVIWYAADVPTKSRQA